MPLTSIYALCEPGSQTPRYIGKTAFPLGHRLSNHVASAKRGKSGPLLSVWVNGLVSNGHRPAIILLEECAPEKADEAEKSWIVSCQEKGCDLLNSMLTTKPAKQKKERSLKPTAICPPLDLHGEALLAWYAKRWGVSVYDFSCAVWWMQDNNHYSMQDAIDTLKLTQSPVEANHDAA